MQLAIFITLLSLVWHASSILIDCEKTDTINEDHIHYCCKHPDGHNEIVAKCANQTGFKVADPNEQSMVDLTAGRAIAGTCFAKCVFDELKLMKDNNLDMKAVHKYLKDNHGDDAEYVKEMYNAFDHCHGQTEENTSKFMSNQIFKHMAHRFCEPKSGVILACVIRQFFHNCPTARWAKTKECETVLQFSKTCRDSLATL